MSDIEQQAIQTYQRNMEYLQKNHPILHKKITVFDSAVAMGEYSEKYALEYNHEGYFDVKELASGEYLYGTNSIEYSRLITDGVNLQKKGAVFSAHKVVAFNPVMVDIIDKSQLSFHNALWATIKIIDYTRRYTLKPNAEMISVYKSIFIDIGLGLHIKDIVEKLNSSIIFIKEHNLELFRLSLFVTDFLQISSNRTLFFSIAQNEADERTSFIEFLEMGNNYNLHIKHIPFNKSYKHDLQVLQTHVLSQSHIMYGYSALLLRYIDSIKYLPLGYGFINVKRTYSSQLLKKKPVLLLLSGPSSSKHIDWIVANRDRFILVTALSTCRLLNKYNLKPDVVVHIDPGADETLKLFQDIDTKSFFKDTICIFSSNVDENTVNKFNKKKVFLIEQGTNYKKDFGNFTCPSVGEYTYTLSLLFGATKIFLLGLDMALEPETLKTHGDFHPFQSEGKKDEYNGSLSYDSSIEYIKGNFLESVPTLATYRLSIQEFERFTKMLKKPNQKVYNLGNGAYLYDATPMHIEEANWNKYKKLDSKKTAKELLSFFSSISSSDFREEDKQTVRYQLQEAIKLEKIIQIFSDEALKNRDKYLSLLSQLSYDLSDMQGVNNSDLSTVYYEYFKTVLGYIFDMFNTKDLEDREMRVKEIHAILIHELMKISRLYINSLESYLK